MSDNIIGRLRKIAEKQTDGSITAGAIFPATLEEAAAALEARDAKITDLKAQIRLKDDAISDLQARDDFLMKVLGMPADELKELQQLIEERKKA